MDEIIAKSVLIKKLLAVGALEIRTMRHSNIRSLSLPWNGFRNYNILHIVNGEALTWGSDNTWEKLRCIEQLEVNAIRTLMKVRQ